MTFKITFAILILSGIQCENAANVQNKPNIVIIMADDLGSHDFSLRGSNEIPTPNIDALGYQGTIFNQHYTCAICTPTRAALLTGKYPIHMGMQHYVLRSGEPRGLPFNEKLLPEYLKDVGYKTHIIGKWHLGFPKKSYIPTNRGFDSHIGYLGGFVDYFDSTVRFHNSPFSPGFDFRRNESVYRDRVGEYLTDVLTDEASKIIRGHNPLQGPLFLYFAHQAPHAANDDDPLQTIPEDIKKMKHIRDPKRRAYAAMIRALDRSIGRIVRVLEEKEMLKNTIILFFSDNGGPTLGLYTNRASNYPLRGQKNSPWEGGFRGAAVLWSPLLRKRHYVSKHLIHITDWLPTFANLAGATSYKYKKLDGYDIWSTISNNLPPIRREILHNINPIDGYSSIYRDGWKYVNGTTLDGQYDSWLGNISQESIPEHLNYPELVMNSDVWQVLNPYAAKVLKAKDIEAIRSKTEIKCGRRIPFSRTCEPLKAPCLFYLTKDPCEISNLAHFRPVRMQVMKERLQHYEKSSIPPSNLPPDPSSDPALNDYLWTWWLENDDKL